MRFLALTFKPLSNVVTLQIVSAIAGLLSVEDEKARDVLDSVRGVRDLILLLLGHEIDRLDAWHNPLSKPAKQLGGALRSDIDRLSSNHTRLTARDWKRHVRVAWRVSTRVAMRLQVSFLLL